MRVSLTWPEQIFAAQAGAMRRISAMSGERPEPHGTPRCDLWGNDIESCGAEMAVAKVLGLYWQSVVRNTEDVNGDVSGVEVRSTTHPQGRLILHDADKDDAPYVLVRGQFPSYELIGWIKGRDGKREEYWFNGDGRAAYFVPDSELRSFPITECSEVTT